MTTIIIAVIFLVVGAAVAAALFEMNRGKSGKCDHSGGCGCGHGGGDSGHGHHGDSHGGDGGDGGSGGDGGGD